MIKSVLILGAGIEQVDCYNSCKKLNIKTLGVDKNINSPGFKISNYKIIESIYKPKFILKKIKKFKNLKIIGILAVGVDCPKTLKDLSKNLNLDILKNNLYKKVGDKIKLYKYLDKFGLSPEYKILKKKKDIFTFIKKNKFPVILKPKDGRGSRNVFLIKSKKELLSQIKINKLILKNNFLIQKFINGNQFSTESLFYNKKHLTLISSRNYKSFQYLHPNIIENGGTLNPKISKNLKDKIFYEIERISNDLKIKNGPFKLDIVVKNNKIFFLEIAIRFGGGFVASRCSKHLLGFNILEEYIKILQKKKTNFSKTIKINNCITNRTIVAKKKGILKKIEIKIPKILKKNILFISKNKKIGEFVKPAGSHADRIIFFSVKARNPEISENIAKKISEHIKLKVS